jgi:hypothetical protein
MSAQLECEVLGQLILVPKLFDSCDLKDILNEDLFTSPDRRLVFTKSLAIRTNLTPSSIDPRVLAQETKLSFEFIMGLTAGNYRPDPVNFGWLVRKIKRQQLSERFLKLAQDEAQHLVKSDDIDEAKINELSGLFEEIKIIAGPKICPADFLKSGTALQALDIKVEWIIDNLIPARALTLLYGRSGIGKTWLSLMMGRAVSSGASFFGLKTKPRPVVYVDYENPLSVLVDRVRRLDIRDVQFWHLSAETRPPKLDSPEWTLFKRLPSGSLLIFDTSRASHDMEENSSEAPAMVMGRLKELRELDHDIILLHHTTKADDQNAKGSTGWYDLADHTLSFCRVKRGTLEEVDDGGGFDPGALLSLGVGKKTRFEPAPRLYLTLNPDFGGLILAESPDAAALNALAEYLAGPGRGQNQTQIIEWAKEAGVGPKMRGSFIALLNRGEREGRWRSYKGLRGARFYETAI